MRQRSLSNALPFKTVLFAFLINPVRGDIAPGDPTPTVAFCDKSFSMAPTSSSIASRIAA
jgi:hypothetical protein